METSSAHAFLPAVSSMVPLEMYQQKNIIIIIIIIKTVPLEPE